MKRHSPNDSAGKCLCGIITSALCAIATSSILTACSGHKTKHDRPDNTHNDDIEAALQDFTDSLRDALPCPDYEVTSEGHITLADKVRRIQDDSTLTREQKREMLKAQIRNLRSRPRRD